MNVDALMNQIRSAVDRELESCAKELLVKAKNLAPKGADEIRKREGVRVHEGGMLEQSGFTEARHISEDIRCYVVGFDTRRVDEGSKKKNFNYAIVQHEKPSSHANGQWKFLETPYKEQRVGYKIRLSKVIGDRGLGDVTLRGGYKLTTKNSGTTTKKFD